MSITAIGTYLPVWGTETVRSAGSDEDAVTMAVDAGRAALAGGSQGPRRASTCAASCW